MEYFLQQLEIRPEKQTIKAVHFQCGEVIRGINSIFDLLYEYKFGHVLYRIVSEKE